MTPRELEEYRALRATIRERGTARVWIFAAGLAVWTALIIATAAFSVSPLATAIPLLLLAGLFETVFALHTGVERIGRYLQVFYEDTAGERHWERTVMAFGRAFPGGGSDPLFCLHFTAAIVANLLPAMLVSPQPIEWLTVGAAHILVLLRIASARRQAAGQRATDLERFGSLQAKSGE
jgi:hypothetical protein